MDYRKFGTTYVMRLDPGDEIVEKVLWLAAVEQIKLATVTGLGLVFPGGASGKEPTC